MADPEFNDATPLTLTMPVGDWISLISLADTSLHRHGDTTSRHNGYQASKKARTELIAATKKLAEKATQ